MRLDPPLRLDPRKEGSHSGQGFGVGTALGVVIVGAQT